MPPAAPTTEATAPVCALISSLMCSGNRLGLNFPVIGSMAVRPSSYCLARYSAARSAATAALQCAGNQGFGGAKRTAFTAAYAPASGFLVSLGILRVPQPHGQPFAVAFTGILLITAVVLFFQAAFVGGLLFFQLFGCRFGTVAPIGADGAVDGGSRLGNGLLFVE